MSENSQALHDALERVEYPKGGSLAASGRVSAATLKDGVASLILDATGLTADERAGLERRLRSAMLTVPGVAVLRIAMSAE